MQVLTTISTLLLLYLLPVSAAPQPGTAVTTRYWDCCKPSCGWPGKALFSAPVRSCSKADVGMVNRNVQSGCNGGGAYMCSDHTPWAVNSRLAYGFAAVSLPNKQEKDTCCACYELTFLEQGVKGKRMIVQATNIGGDLSASHFDLAIPGGGVGQFNGCAAQFGAPANGWGERYGGIKKRSDCAMLPQKLRRGCYFRFDWFKGADNPGVKYRRVRCPKALVDKTRCRRKDE